MKFLNRKEERARLNRNLQSKESRFIVIYGRRRCGKSTLIKKVLNDSDIYFLADMTESTHQISLLARDIAYRIPGFDNVVYPNWEAIFENLNARLQEKITLCLDEFPYLVKSSPTLPATIQKIIDNKLNSNFNLVICGSSQQLMQGLVFDKAEPLFGRADEILKIRPMKIAYLKEMLNCDSISAIEEYAVWGGVPRYWELRSRENSLDEALLYHVLSPFGILYDEPMRLFVDDMRDTVQASTILSVIGNGVNRMSEIASRMNKPATNLSSPLERLIMLGYIERELPYSESIKNSKKSLYKISDPFLDFYFTFVVPNRSLIELERNQQVLSLVKQQFNRYVSLHWESLCRQAVPAMEIDGILFKEASRWWGSVGKDKSIELDVVSESVCGKYILIGECKWSDNENVESLLQELSVKAELLPFIKDKIVIKRLFLKSSSNNSDAVVRPDDVIQFLS